MQIDIQARHFSLTESLRNHAERRLRFTLTSFDDYIFKLLMRLSDINGPRGGKDKRCHLQVILTGLPDIIIEDTEADLYIAIDRAVSRAGRSVKRKIDRHQTLLKHRSHLPLEINQFAEQDISNSQTRGF
ncbi:MAG: HPF/RaiA family ribosome-associated protein [Thiotrichaceae bacterium]|nr:HPF/RaiA family ribosome-associated protein [Thiotrichaceae bacterium]